jgi:hypothetical protein
VPLCSITLTATSLLFHLHSSSSSSSSSSDTWPAHSSHTRPTLCVPGNSNGAETVKVCGHYTVCCAVPVSVPRAQQQAVDTGTNALFLPANVTTPHNITAVASQAAPALEHLAKAASTNERACRATPWTDTGDGICDHTLAPTHTCTSSCTPALLRTCPLPTTWLFWIPAVPCITIFPPHTHACILYTHVPKLPNSSLLMKGCLCGQSNIHSSHMTSCALAFLQCWA